jgi:hypothetical protein
MICKGYLPYRRSARSVNHMDIVIAIMIFDLFQIAILRRFLEPFASGG